MSVCTVTLSLITSERWTAFVVQCPICVDLRQGGKSIGVPEEHTTTLIDHHIPSIPEKVNFSGIIYTGISGHNLIYGNKKLNPIHKTHKKKKIIV